MFGSIGAAGFGGITCEGVKNTFGGRIMHGGMFDHLGGRIAMQQLTKAKSAYGTDHGNCGQNDV
jgi:hypothetical protein